jgi:hypothetical protein
MAAFLLRTPTPAVACSCASKSEGDKVSGVISFDGQVLDLPAFERDTAGGVRVRIRVVRPIKGEPGSEVSIVTGKMETMCGAADRLARARAGGRTLEFHIWPPRTGRETPDLPAGELHLSFCGLYPSELAPDPPRAQR